MSPIRHEALGGGAEFDLIRRIAQRIGAAAGPLGDDCAVLEWPGGHVVMSTDATIESVHFRTGWLSTAEIGYRAVARALSDLAADGASPVGVLVALAAPSHAPHDAVVQVMTGAADAAAAAATRVLGGDLSVGTVWHLVVTVVGAAARPVTRAGAQPGDGLWVSGALGTSRAAVDAWRAGREPAADARRAFATPSPRLGLGQALGAAGARAMIDLSDGLAGDVGHLAAASAVRIVVDLGQVPVAAAAAEAAALAETPGDVYAAAGGEDYELLAAMPPGFDEAAAAAITAREGVALTRIGRVEQGGGAVLLRAGEPVELGGWDHFNPR